jgi:hypothetical protein
MTAAIVTILVMVARGRWRPAVAWAGAAAVAITVVAFPVSIGPLQDLQTCTADRRAAALTVPPYGGAPQDLSGGFAGCGYALALTEPVGPVVAYYRRGFEQAGWSVTTTSAGEGQIEGGGTLTAGELTATRGERTVSIVYEGADDGTYASVSVTAT